MDALRFDTGKKTFLVNDSCEISFYPSDIGFIDRLTTAMEKAAEITDERTCSEETKEIFAFAKEKDRRIRSVIDSVFGEVSDKLFPDYYCYALVHGVPVWFAFAMSVFNACDADITSQMTQSKPTMQKYLDKYNKYRK